MADPIRVALERLHQYSYMCPEHDTDEIVAAARAALAAASDGPTVPEGREPAAVAAEASDEELLELWHGSDWYDEGATLREFRSIARAVLARWGRPATAPAEVLPVPQQEVEG